MTGPQIDFDWDPSKAASNLVKHGVSFEEALTVFGDQLALTIFDPDHSEQEERRITLGQAKAGRLLVVVHTDEERDGSPTSIRIISARVATKKETLRYREGLSQ